MLSSVFFHEQAATTQAGQTPSSGTGGLSPAALAVFHAVEWRTLNAYGEAVNQGDLVVFHPGVVVIEVRLGPCRSAMIGTTPRVDQTVAFRQARNRYALEQAGAAAGR